MCVEQISYEEHKFFVKIKNKYPQLFDNVKLLSPYIDWKSWIFFEDKYGTLKKKPENLYRGTPFTIMNAVDKTSYITNMFREIYGYLYDYSLVVFKGMDKKVSIICKKHGIFKKTPYQHLNNKQICTNCSNEYHGRNQWMSQEDFLDKLKINNPIAFEDLIFLQEYRGYRNPIKALSPIGVVYPTPLNLLKGKSYTSVGRGWNRSDWINFVNRRDAYCYLIECFDEKETFYKVGITVYPKSRFKPHNLPYNYKIINLIQGDAGFVFDLESSLKAVNKHNKYVPKKDFHGKTECFSSLLPEQEIEKIIRVLCER